MKKIHWQRVYIWQYPIEDAEKRIKLAKQHKKYHLIFGLHKHPVMGLDILVADAKRNLRELQAKIDKIGATTFKRRK
jgi:hypothetical protein